METNYIKEAFLHNYNLIFVGLVLFLMLAINFWGFFYAGVAGELLVWLISYSQYFRRVADIESAEMTESEKLNTEEEILKQLRTDDRDGFFSIRDTCESICRRIKNTRSEKEIKSKLIDFRYKYVLLLEERSSLRKLNSNNSKLKELEKALETNTLSWRNESNAVIKNNLQINIKILTTRIQTFKRIGERLKEIEVHLDLVKNSLELLYDDYSTSRGTDDVISMVDSLISTMDIQKPVEDLDLSDLRLPKKDEIKETVYEKRSRING